MDFLASFASLVNSNITTEESKNLLDVLPGKTNKGRDELIIEATTRKAFRSGDYVMIPPYKGPEFSTSVNIELGIPQIFNFLTLRTTLVI